MGTHILWSLMRAMSTVLYLQYFLCASSFVYVASQAVCGGGYTHTVGGSCYAYVDKPESWFDAQSLCRATGGFLAEGQTVEQNNLIKKLLHDHKAYAVWLGGSDLFQEGKWFWAHSGYPIEDFDDWRAGQPDDANGGENCMNLPSKWNHWNDGDCDTKYPSVCQKPILSDVVLDKVTVSSVVG